MLNQDGVPVEGMDEQLRVEHGIWHRGQKQPDEELKAKLPGGTYDSQQPTTYWTTHLQRKNYYQSAAVGSNPFAKTSGLTQTADQTKAVIGHYGNIDFEAEAKRT